jgi:hypothetical protein
MAFSGDYMCDSFKVELLKAEHNFQPAGHSFKIALYDDTSTLDNTTTAYTATGELAATGNYTTTGQALTNASGFPQWDTDTAICDFDDEVFSNATFSAMGALIYNDTHASDAAVIVLDFVTLQTATAGDFTIQFPAPVAATAIIRIA